MFKDFPHFLVFHVWKSTKENEKEEVNFHPCLCNNGILCGSLKIAQKMQCLGSTRKKRNLEQ